jgi:hypothetical protein
MHLLKSLELVMDDEVLRGVSKKGVKQCRFE